MSVFKLCFSCEPAPSASPSSLPSPLPIQQHSETEHHPDLLRLSLSRAEPRFPPWPLLPRSSFPPILGEHSHHRIRQTSEPEETWRRVLGGQLEFSHQFPYSVLLQRPPLTSLWDHDVSTGLKRKKEARETGCGWKAISKTWQMQTNFPQNKWVNLQDWLGSATKGEVLLWLLVGVNPEKGVPFCLPLLSPCVPQSAHHIPCCHL